MNLEKLATVLERAADYIDAVEGEKHAAANEAAQTRLSKLASQWKAATGEDLDPEQQKKLAASDPQIVSLIEGMVEKQASAPDSLGGPSNTREDPTPTSVKEAAEAAWDRFGSFLMS